MSVPEIVITGGPCAGKTTAFSYLTEWLLDLGFRVFTIPEAATLVIQNGVQDIGRIATENFPLYLEFQRHILERQQRERELTQRFAANFPEAAAGKAVILSDRGPMDGLAYLPAEWFSALLYEAGLGLKDVRDNYDGVIHLVTAAIGAEAFYTTSNNTARRESPAEARILDARTQAAWIGSPHLRVIDNSTDFEGKMRRLKAALARILGIPVPLEIERKFLLRRMPDLHHLPDVQASRIAQVYLLSSPREQVRLRQRVASDNSATYYRTVKSDTATPGVRIEREERIKPSQYLAEVNLRDPRTRPISKIRYCFVWHSQYFELDVITDPEKRLYLEVELTEENDAIELPPFLDIDRDVTDDPAFSNYHLSKIA